MDITEIYDRLERGEATAKDQAEAASFLKKLVYKSTQLVIEREDIKQEINTMMELQGQFHESKDKVIDMLSERLGIPSPVPKPSSV